MHSVPPAAAKRTNRSANLGQSRFHGCERRTRRDIDHNENLARFLRDHAARGIADGTAEGTRLVREDRPAFQMPRSFTDTFVDFARRAMPQRDGRAKLRLVVTPKRPARFEEAEISDIHGIRYPIQTLSLYDAAQ